MIDLKEQIDFLQGLPAKAITTKNALFQLSSEGDQEDQENIDAAKKEVKRLTNVVEETIQNYKDCQLVEGVRVTKDPTPEQEMIVLQQLHHFHLTLHLLICI